MELKFDLNGRKYMTIERLFQLEESIGWISNATPEMASESKNYVFVTRDGNISPMNDKIIDMIQRFAEINQKKTEFLGRLKRHAEG